MDGCMDGWMDGWSPWFLPRHIKYFQSKLFTDLGVVERGYEILFSSTGLVLNKYEKLRPLFIVENNSITFSSLKIFFYSSAAEETKIENTIH